MKDQQSQVHGWPRVLGVLAATATILAACGPAAQEATSTRAQSLPSPTARPAATPVTLQGTAQPQATLTPMPATRPAAVPKLGGVLRAYNRAHPTAWDPTKVITGSIPLRNVEKSVFSAITMRGVIGEEPCAWSYVNDSAEKWSWLNDTTFEIKLRQGVKFHNKPPVNGRELTADDVVWSWKRIFAVNPRFSAEAEATKDIVAQDRYTVRFITKAPIPSLVSLLGHRMTSNVLAREAGDFSGDKQWGDWNRPERSYIGTGPFMWKQDVSGVKVILEKHPNYYKPGQPYLDGLEFVTIPDVSTRLAALIGGRLDLWFAEAGAAQAFFVRKAAPYLSVQKCPTRTPLTVYMNTSESPFNDVRVRRAVLMAMDQRGLIESAFLQEAIASGIAPLLDPWFLKPEDFPAELRKYLEYNPTEAKKLLAEAGYPQGFETVFNYYPGYGSPLNEATEGLASMLEKVGIRARLRAMERVAYDTMKSTGDFHGMTPTKGGSGTDEPLTYLPSFHSQTPLASNVGHVADRELDRLIEDFRVTADEARAKDLARRIQYRLLEQALVLQPPAHFDYSIAQPYVKGFSKGGDEQVSRWWSERVWLDK